jgi:hypothetical protein
LLVTLVALPALTRARPVVLVLAMALVAANVVNNASRFEEAVAFYGRAGRPPRIPPAVEP